VKHLFAAAAIAAGLTIAGSASAGVVLSQNFDSIDIHAPGFNPASPGFQTDYAFRTGSQNTPDHVNSMYDEGTWTIAQNPINSHNLWRDEDLGSNALILNGKTLPPGDPNSTAWAQTATGVGAGHYTFSFDAYDVCCNANFGGFNAASLLTLSYSLNGGSTLNAATIDTSTTVFETAPGSGHYHVTGSFDLGQSGDIKVSLLNWAGAPGGNDFAVDNISVAGGVPEPATWAMMLVGFGGLGAMLRANRRRMASATA